jgi:hypothetical protein
VIDLAAEAAVADQVRSLTPLTLQQLREVWRRLYGAPPALRSVELLRGLLAWRIQADATAGLGRDAAAALSSPEKLKRQPILPVGARVAREWRGVRHEVEVLEHGVRYAGRTYSSLSEVARQITGTRWSGPRFFGLVQR